MEEMRRGLGAWRNRIINVEKVINDDKLCAIEEMDGRAFFESLDRFPHGFFPSFIDAVQNSLWPDVFLYRRLQGNQNFDELIKVLNEFKQSGLLLNVPLLNQIINECESRNSEGVRIYLIKLKCQYARLIANSSLLPYLKLLRSFRIRQLIAGRRQSLIDGMVIDEDSLEGLEKRDSYEDRTVEEHFNEAFGQSSKLMDDIQHELEKPDTDYQGLEYLLMKLRDNSECLGDPAIPAAVDAMFETIDCQDPSKDRVREYFNRVKTRYAAFNNQTQQYVEMLREEAMMTNICSGERYHPSRNVEFIDRLQPYLQWLSDDSAARLYMRLSWRSSYFLL